MMQGMEDLAIYILTMYIIIALTFILSSNRMKILSMLIIFSTYVLYVFRGGWTNADVYATLFSILIGFINIFELGGKTDV